MSKLLENTVVVSVRCRMPGVQRRMRPGEAVVRRAGAEDEDGQADQTCLRVSKELLRSATYKEIGDLVRDLKSRIDSRRVDARSLLRGGSYMVPVASVESLVADIEATIAKFEAKADAFADEYPARVEEARNRLGEFWDAREYPSAERVRAAFGLEYQLLDLAVPGESKLGEVIHQAQVQAFAARVKNAEQEVWAALRVGLLDAIKALANVLSPKPDGKRRALRDGRIERFHEFLAGLKPLNVMADGELDAIAAEARALVAGRSTESIRANDDLREAVRSGMAAVAAKLEAMCVDLPARKFKQ